MSTSGWIKMALLLAATCYCQGRRDRNATTSGQENAAAHQDERCARVQELTDNSGAIFHKVTGLIWSNCTFELRSRMRSSGALAIVRIYALELHEKESWSTIEMPAGDRIAYNVTTPTYREGQLPWCGIYMKKESSRARAANEGLCPGQIQVASQWPPRVTINATNVRISLWYAVIDCRNKARQSHNVDVVEIPEMEEEDKLGDVEPPSLSTTTAAENVCPAGDGSSNVESEESETGRYHTLLAIICVMALVIGILILAIIIYVIRSRSTRGEEEGKPTLGPEVARNPSTATTTYRQYDRVSTLPKECSNKSFRPQDHGPAVLSTPAALTPPIPMTPVPPMTPVRPMTPVPSMSSMPPITPPTPSPPIIDTSTDYQYIDLPVFTPTYDKVCDMESHFATAMPDQDHRSSDDRPIIMSTSSELVANEIYHLPRA